MIFSVLNPINLKLVYEFINNAGPQIADSLVRNALAGNRGGNSGGSGGGGGGSDFFNSLRYGGLFNENNGHGMSGKPGDKPKVTVTGAGPGGMYLNQLLHID